MSGLLELLGENASVVAGVCGPIAVVAAGYMVWRLRSSAEESSPAPATASPGASALDQGLQARRQAGLAKTAKLGAEDRPEPSIRPAPAAVPAKPSEDPTQKKVERLSEIGFHHTVERGDTPRPLPVIPTAAVVATAASAEPAPGSRPDLDDTPELDDILSRIDKVLSENPLMATSTITGNQPSTERIESAGATTEPFLKVEEPPAPPEQQKLF